jgi:hypothetical protein
MKIISLKILEQSIKVTFHHIRFKFSGNPKEELTPPNETSWFAAVK